MTVCTPHKFAGPHECPYCQRDALTAELKEKQEVWLLTEKLLAAEKEAHARTQHWLDEFQGSTAAGTVEAMRLRGRIAALEATIEDISRGSTHELVRYWIEKTVAAEKQLENEQRVTRFASNTVRDELMDERAAHEQTKAALYQAQQELHPVDQAQANEAAALLRAEAAEARVKEMEAVDRSWYDKGFEEGALAAESALASARTLARDLDDALENDGPLLPIQYKFRAWLASHPEPAPVAAPCAGCGKPERECPQYGDECWRNNGCPEAKNVR